MKFFELSQHRLVPDDVGLELLVLLPRELLEELLAPLGQLHLFLVLVQEVEVLIGSKGFSASSMSSQSTPSVASHAESCNCDMTKKALTAEQLLQPLR